MVAYWIAEVEKSEMATNLKNIRPGARTCETSKFYSIAAKQRMTWVKTPELISERGCMLVVSLNTLWYLCILCVCFACMHVCMYVYYIQSDIHGSQNMS